MWKSIRNQWPLYVLLAGMAVILLLLTKGEKGESSPVQTQSTETSSSSTKINIGGWTDSPQISPDGKRLYFMYSPLDFEAISARQEYKRGGPNRPGATTTGDSVRELANFDIFEATRGDNGSWKVSAISAINTPDHLEICPSITFSGKRLYFVRSGRIGKKGKDVVYVSQRSGNSWGKPHKTKIPIGSSCDIALSADEKEVFLDDDPVKHGSVPREIRYARQLGNGRWSHQRKLSRSVNSPTHWQGGPWLSKDGKRLYFDRSKGLSDWQLMVAVRQTTTSFNRPRALPLKGFPNTPATGEPIAGVPSLTADERTLYVIVVNENNVPEVWLVKRRADGSWTPAQAVD